MAVKKNLGGRPTDAQLALKKAEGARLARYEAQEALRAPRIQVDQSVVMRVWLVGIGVAFVASAIISFNGITAISAYVGLSAAWMQYLFFFFIEVMYLIFLVAYLVLASRVDETTGSPEKTKAVEFWMWVFVGISIASNGFHTLDYWLFAFGEPRMWAGFILSVSAPVATVMAGKLATRVVFARAVAL